MGEKRSSPVAMPLPPSATRLVVQGLEQEASAARMRGDLILESKLKIRIEVLTSGRAKDMAR